MAHKRLKQQSFHDSPPDQSRFNTLPEELKDKILDYFSFEDAARTGILSSTSNWSEHSQVILDKLLFEERGRWIGLRPTEWVKEVAKILSNHHKGLIPIRKFILHIPDMQFNWELYINIWIQFLSSNVIKELSVDNWNIITCKLSCFLSKCDELKRLMLRNCIFKKPDVDFQNLQFLRLEKIAFGSVEGGGVKFSTPSLVRGELSNCTGFQYLNIHAPKLENFVVSWEQRGTDDMKQLKQLTLNEDCCGFLKWRVLGRTSVYYLDS